jgi:hypothetical protein
MERKRWPRGQKFKVSPTGERAQDVYCDAVNAARASGRAALETSIAAWASPLLVEPGDGVVLCELAKKQLGVPKLVEALEPTGIGADQVRAGLERLLAAGLVELVPLASQLATMA